LSLEEDPGEKPVELVADMLNTLQNLPAAFWLPLVAGIGMMLLGLFESERILKVRVVTFLCGSLSLVGGVFASVDQQKNDERAEAQAEKIRVNQAELQAKAEHIANLNDEIKGLVTGGDSYCFLRFRNGQTPFGPGNTVRRIEVALVGEYPLHDVRIEVFDLRALAEVGDQLSPEDIQRKVRKLSEKLEVLVKGADKIIFPDAFPWPEEGNSGRYAIVISASNGEVYQAARVEKVHGVWRYAWRVWKAGGAGSPLQDYADSEFPRNAAGSIDWWDSPSEGAAQFGLVSPTPGPP
jgi:hypothetical protein